MLTMRCTAVVQFGMRRCGEPVRVLADGRCEHVSKLNFGHEAMVK